MSSIKLIALDLDGTLLSDAGRVEEADKRAIAKAIDRGVGVVISSGREPRTIRRVQHEGGFSGYINALNGALIISDKGEEIFKSYIGAAAFRAITAAALKENIFYRFVHSEYIYHCADIPPDGELRPDIRFINHDGIDDSMAETASVIIAYHRDAAILTGFIRRIREAGHGVSVTQSWSSGCDIMAAGVSKLSGIKKICDHMGIGLENVMAVGDYLNDMEIISAAGVGVAMGNALDEVKAASDFVTSDNNSGGVARAIEKFVLV